MIITFLLFATVFENLGMIAAIAAAENGHKVTLYEHNEKLGKKLFITGKGRCNVTNASDIDEIFNNIVTNSKFLQGAAASEARWNVDFGGFCDAQFCGQSASDDLYALGGRGRADDRH